MKDGQWSGRLRRRLARTEKPENRKIVRVPPRVNRADANERTHTYGALIMEMPS